MALNVNVVEITQPGATGNQTYSLPANFDPKAILFFTAGMAAMETNTAGWTLGLGMATYRGAAVQQRYWTGFHTDAALNMDVAQRAGDEACIGLLIDGGAGGLDMEADLVSMQTGATSQFVLNWVGLHTTASVRVWALVLGGSDITDALVHGFPFSTSVATQNVDVSAQTGGSGWVGQPDLIFSLLSGQGDGGTLNTTQQWLVHSFGVGWDDTNVRGVAYSQDEANTSSFVLARQETTTKFLFDGLRSDGVNGEDYRGTLSAKASWPANGYQLSYGVQSLFADHLFCLALQGTFTKTLHTALSPTAGGLPVVNNYDHGSVPTGALAWGWNMVTSTGIRETDANLVSVGFGAYDGSNEMWMAVADDDLSAAAALKRRQSNTRSWQNYRQDGVVANDADGAFSGNNYQESYTALDTIAREHFILTLGSGGEAVTYPSAVPDFQREAFPFLIGDSRMEGVSRAGARWRVGGRPGPAPIGGFERFIFPRLHPSYEVVTDINVPVSAATALGVTPNPLVQVEVPSTSTVALGTSPLPVIDIVKPAGAAIAFGITPAPTVVAGPVTTAPAAALALGVAPSPLVLVTVPTSAALAAGFAPAATPSVAQAVTASLAAGSTLAPAVFVVVPIGPALGIGVTPAPTVISGSGATVIASAAVALGTTPQPVVLITVPTTAGLALGVTPAPVIQVVKPVTAAVALGTTVAPVAAVARVVTASLALGSTAAAAVNVVVPLSAALALGVTPAPTVVIAGNVTVIVGPAVAFGSAPAPTPVITRPAAAALAAGSTLNPAIRMVVFPAAARAIGATPAPVVIAGVLIIPGTATVTDVGQYSAAIADLFTQTVVATEMSQQSSTVSDEDGQEATVTDGGLYSVSIS
jgi:hypothetical protein